MEAFAERHYYLVRTTDASEKAARSFPDYGFVREREFGDARRIGAHDASHRIRNRLQCRRAFVLRRVVRSHLLWHTLSIAECGMRISDLERNRFSIRNPHSTFRN